MPFPMKIQPIDSDVPEEPSKTVVKSRLKRLFERQFLKISADERAGPTMEVRRLSRGSSGEFDPSSLCLDRMVQNFLEDNDGEKLPGALKCKRCNCFNGNRNDSSDDEWDSCRGFGGLKLASTGDACEMLKSLVTCASMCERDLLADTSKIVEKNKNCKRKDGLCRKTVVDGLLALGYNASICNSHWEKSSSCPAGDYEYVDVMTEGERLLIDVDFRSEFEIARSTKAYKSILQMLPLIFVGKADRLQKIITIVSEAANQSLKKRGMHVPPWRKLEYVRAKWLSPYTRANDSPGSAEKNSAAEKELPPLNPNLEAKVDLIGNTAGPGEPVSASVESSPKEEEKGGVKVPVKQMKPPEIKARSLIGAKMVTGLASVIDD